MRDVAPFFKAVSPEQLADPGEKLRPVIEFKKQIQQQYSHLYVEFDEVESFRRKVRKLLFKWSQQNGDSRDAISAPLDQTPSGGGRDFVVPAELDNTNRSEEVVEAERLADEGKLVDAEVAFAKLTVGRLDLDAMNRYGHCLTRVGRLAQAEQMYRKVLESAESHDWHAIALGNLDLIEQTRGNPDAARDLWVRARDLLAEIGMPNDAAKVQSLIDGLDAPLSAEPGDGASE